MNFKCPNTSELKTIAFLVPVITSAFQVPCVHDANIDSKPRRLCLDVFLKALFLIALGERFHEFPKLGAKARGFQGGF